MTDDSNRYLWPGSPEWLALEEIRLRKESLATMFGGGGAAATLAASAFQQIEYKSIAERIKHEDQAKQGWCDSPASIGSYASLVHDEFVRVAAGLDRPGSRGYLLDARSVAEAEAARHLASIAAPAAPTIADWKAQACADLISTGMGACIPWGILSGTITDNLALQRARELYEPDYYARSFLETIKAAGQPDSMIAEAMRTTESSQFRDYLASLDDNTVEELISSEEREEEAKEAVRAKLQEAAADPAVLGSHNVADDLQQIIALHKEHGGVSAAIKAEAEKIAEAKIQALQKRFDETFNDALQKELAKRQDALIADALKAGKDEAKRERSEESRRAVKCRIDQKDRVGFVAWLTPLLKVGKVARNVTELKGWDGFCTGSWCDYPDIRIKVWAKAAGHPDFKSGRGS